MALTSIVSISDGPRTTVADLVGNPLVIPTKLKELIENQYISPALFRNAGGNVNGLVKFNRGNPLFLSELDVQEVSEFGEIPVSSGQMGTPMIATGVKRGLGVRVSKEMIDENQLDAVNLQMTQLRNTFVRADARVARKLLEDNVPTMAVPTAWNAVGGDPLKDIGVACDVISSAAPSAELGGTDDEDYGFEPDTIVMHPGLWSTIAYNPNIAKLYIGNIASENPILTNRNTRPQTLGGLNVLTSKSFPRTKVLILERSTIGFVSETRPLQFTPLYPEGNGPNGGPRETFRVDATEKVVRGLDQPAAGLWLTGIEA